MNLNNFKNHSFKKKITHSVVLFAVFSISTIYFIIMPSIVEIVDLRKQIIDKKADNASKHRIEKSAILLNKKISAIKERASIIEEIFINKNRELEFITALENIADKNNVTQKINLMTPSDKDNKKEADAKKNKTTKKTGDGNDILSSSLTINIEGNYKNILNYLSEISSLRYYVNIEGLSFTGKPGGSNPVDGNSDSRQTVVVNINAKTYWE